MNHLPVNKNVKFAKLLSTNTLFANLSLLAAIAIASAALVLSGLAINFLQNTLNPSSLSSSLPQNSLNSPNVFADSASTPASSLAFAAYDRALASIQAQLTSVSSPAKLGKSGILTITDSGILKPTDHNQTQGGIGTDVSRIGKIWGTFMDLNDDISINGKLDLAGKLTANGNVTLGNNDGDEIEVGGRFTSNLVPKKTNDIDIGTTGLRFRTGYFVNSLVIGSGTTTITTSGITTTGGSSTTITSSLLNLVSTGTLQLDTSTNNNNILLLTGTGNIGIGSTAPSAKLDVVGDMALNGDLDFTGTQSITTTSDNLTLSPTGNLVIDTSGGTVSIRDAAIDLTNQPTTISGSTLTLRSTGTFILDTSANNTNIALQAGTGTLNISAATARLTGNLIVTGTETFNGIAYTFPGTQTASGVLTTDGAGILSWGTIGAANITADSLDFAQFDDSLDLDADTSINGDYSLIVRSGLGSIQNSTSGSNDLQLSAEDKLILGAASFDLSTSSGAIDIISNQRLDLSSGGTLTLDTSQNNTNIVLTPGTGNIGIGSTAPVYKLDVNGTLRTTSTARIEGALTVTTGGASVTGDLTLDGDLDFTGAQNITTTADNLTISPTGNLIIDTSGGTLSIRDAAIDLTNQPTTISGSSLTLRATGNFILDTSANNTNLVLQGGTGGLTGSFGTANLTAVTDSVSSLYLNAQRGGITLSSSNASGNGPIKILSGGSLQLSTSQGNQPIYLQAGTGSINLSSGTTTISGNVNLNSGTLTLNGLTYTFPGADSANGVLLTDGSGILSWSTGLTGSSLADDTLDFVDLQDELDLDADTSINGDYSLIVRAGLGSIQNSTSGSNDLQLSAEDKLVLGAASFDLLTSSGAVDILSGSYLDLSSKGTLTLDTSQNNTNILLKAGTGSINLSSGTTTISGNVNLNSGTLALNGVAYTFPGADSANGVLLSNGSGGLSWTTIGASSITADSLDFAQFDDSLDLDADTSINGPYSFIVRAGNAARQNATSGNNDLQLSAEDQILIHGSSMLLETSSASAGQLVIRSDGTLQLDTSANNTNLVLQGGTGGLTGSFGTANLTAVTDSVSSLYLNAQRGGITLSSANASGNGPIRILSGGSLQLSTSQGNQPIYLQVGTGSINLSSGTTTISGNVNLNSGTLALNGVAYTFPGADGSASNVLTTSGTGLLSWGTLGAASITADSLDFTEFKDALTMDADTSINGDYSLVLRSGLGSIQNSTSGSNDLQLSAEDKLILGAASFDLLTSSGAVDILSGSYLDLSSKGTLTLDTSQNNTNILLKAGTGSINLSSGTTTISGNVNLNSGTLTLNGVAYTFPGADGSSGQALSTNGSGILSWAAAGSSFTDNGTYIYPANTSRQFIFNPSGVQTTSGFFEASGDDDIILRAGLGAIDSSVSGNNDIQLAAEDRIDLYATSYSLTTSGNSVDILSGGRIDLSAKGTLTLDTSQNNSQILIRAGTGRVDVSGNTILVNAGTGTLTLSSSGSITIGGEGATTRVSGDLNFTGRLMEDGNEILGNMIAPFASTCPTGWTEYTSARGRVVVGTPSGGTNAGTVGTAYTNLEDRTHTHTGPSHTHTVNSAESVGYGPGTIVPSGGSATSSSGTGATGATSATPPYIQLTYCQKTAGSDIAEWISTSENLSKETIISVDPNNNEKVIASKVPYDQTVVGVISTKPGWLMGDQTNNSVQLALAGRVPTRVSLKNGEIKRGDPITTSDIPGVGMKATRSGEIIGKAMEELKGDAGATGTIIVFINPSHYNPDTYSPEEDQLFLTSIDPMTGNVNVGGRYGVIRKSGGANTQVLTSQAFREAIIGQLAVGNANVAGNLTANDVLLDGISLKDQIADLTIETSNSHYTLTTSLESLTQKVESNEQRTMSNEQRITQLEDYLALTTNYSSSTLSTSSDPSAYSLLSTPYSLSGSYMNNELAIQTATNLTYDSSTNTTHVLGSATIGGNLTVGLLTINDMDASINSMGETLKLQSLGMGNIELMAGGAVIDTKGNLLLKSGDLNIEKGKIAGNASFRDAVILPAGQGSLRIDASWDTVPVTINVTSTWDTTVWVEDITGPALNPSEARGSGFTIHVSRAPASDSRLFWLAIW